MLSGPKCISNTIMQTLAVWAGDARQDRSSLSQHRLRVLQCLMIQPVMIDSCSWWTEVPPAWSSAARVPSRFVLLNLQRCFSTCYHSWELWSRDSCFALLCWWESSCHCPRCHSRKQHLHPSQMLEWPSVFRMVMYGVGGCSVEKVMLAFVLEWWWRSKGNHRYLHPFLICGTWTTWEGKSERLEILWMPLSVIPGDDNMGKSQQISPFWDPHISPSGTMLCSKSF